MKLKETVSSCTIFYLPVLVSTGTRTGHRADADGGSSTKSTQLQFQQTEAQWQQQQQRPGTAT